ncbi:MAG: hypothetical protein PHW13_11890 [Methylococcales bacterium]|nr:hypothetical protein [Methylococcales bacterium]
MDIYEQEQAARRREAESLRRQRLADEDFRMLAELPAGRRFIRRLLGECGVHQSSYAGDALGMAFREGRRSVGLWLQGLFADCPDAYICLLKTGDSDFDEGDE